MYHHILIPLENTDTDQTILNHIIDLAKLMKSKITLIHVADGFGARYQKQLNLTDSEEMIEDRNYLEIRVKELKTHGFDADFVLQTGDPVKKILECAHTTKCDLIAMATHGHGMFKDFLFGSVASDVRHRTAIPVLLLKNP